MEYVFVTSQYDVEALVPEVSRALEKRLELASRERLPGLWKRTDELASGAAPRQMPRGRVIYRRIIGVIMIALGLFLLIPALVKPSEMPVAVITGICGVIVGVNALRSTRRKTANPQGKRARNLLDGIASGDPAEVRFLEAGMRLSDRSVVFFEELEYFIETESGYLLTWGSQGIFLQKKDLIGDAAENFEQFVSERISRR